MYNISHHKFFLFLIVITIAIGVGSMWWSTSKEYLARRQGQEISATTPPLALQPTHVPTTTLQPQAEPQTSGDTRSWGERFRDKTIPEVEGVTWQTYTDTEYGFEMEYPKGWGVEKEDVKTSGGVAFMFYRIPNSHDPYSRFLSLNIYRGKLRDALQRDGYWSRRIEKNGLVPDAKINGMDVYIYASELHDPQQVDLFLSLERNNFVYHFTQPMGTKSYENDEIIEHMIKSFKFQE
jgi:hypothetical protein